MNRQDNRVRPPKEWGSPRFLNEAPDVVGKMSAVLENGGSLDTAIREVAADGPVISRGFFGEIVLGADTRVEPDMAAALSAKLSAIPECNSPFSMAIRMVMSASGAKDSDNRSRILKEASDIALNGLKESGKTFCSSLNSPCMMIFGLGIMVPMVLMSVLPMMGMSGLFGSSAFDPRMLSVITLVLIPSVVLAVILTIKEKNPLKAEEVRRPALPFLGFLAAIPSFLLFYGYLGLTADTLCLSIMAASILVLVLSYGNGISRKNNRKMAPKLRSAVFEIGNRLFSGSSFENSVIETFSAREECSYFAESFRNELALCRGDVESAIVSVFGPISEEFTDILVSIRRVSCRDLREAGKLALNLGRQTKDRESIRLGIRNDLKSMTDTMFGTAAVFAPLVLGMSVSILEPMKKLTGITDDGSTSIILVVYLTELSAVISVLLSILDGNGGAKEIMHRFATLVPLSMLVFLVALRISL